MENSIGALWENEGKDGRKFYAGKITLGGVETAIVVFKNDYKKADNHPDYRIFIPNKHVTPAPQNNEECSPF